MHSGPVKIRDPQQIRFIHQTISPTLSKPKSGEEKCPHLDSLVARLEKGEQSMLEFPPIQIFSIRDPQTHEKVYYSLNNRKLYLAKKSHSPQINTVKASFEEILDSLWKMTSQTDGCSFPNRTHDGNKTCMPTGLLLQFRQYLAVKQELLCLNMRSDDDETPYQRLLRDTRSKFQLKCRG